MLEDRPRCLSEVRFGLQSLRDMEAAQQDADSSLIAGGF